RAVNDHGDGADGQPCLRQDTEHAVHHAFLRRGRGGQHLLGVSSASGLDHHVGEGAADIDCQTNARIDHLGTAYPVADALALPAWARVRSAGASGKTGAFPTACAKSHLSWSIPLGVETMLPLHVLRSTSK